MSTLTLPPIARDIQGGKVDRVLVSEGTKQMAVPADRKVAVPRIVDTSAFRSELVKNVARNQQLQGELATLSAQVGGTRLPAAQYSALMNRRALLVKEQQDLIVRAAELKRLVGQGLMVGTKEDGDHGPSHIQMRQMQVMLLQQLSDQMAELIGLVKDLASTK